MKINVITPGESGHPRIYTLRVVVFTAANFYRDQLLTAYETLGSPIFRERAPGTRRFLFERIRRTQHRCTEL